MVNSKHLSSIHWEISSACQASCPCCKRKTSDGKLANFQQSYTSLSQVERTLQDISELDQVTFCGNIGDPMSNPEIVDIVAFIRNKYNCLVQINTNGGIGRPENYSQLAELGVNIIFGVDGTKGINELHRYNVNFDYVDRNIRCFANNRATNSKLIVQFLVWDQNIGNLPKFVDWSKDVGIDSLHIRQSNDHGEFTDVTNNRGQIVHTLTKKNQHGYLEILNQEVLLDQFDDLLDQWKALLINYSELPFNKVDNENVDAVLPVSKSTYQQPIFFKQAPWTVDDQERLHDLASQKNPVNCISLVKQANRKILSIYISHDGYVFPCCFIGTAVVLAQNGEKTNTNLINRLHKLGIDRLNTHLRTLTQILDDGILSDLVYNKLWSNEKLPFCGQVCNVKNTIVSYRSI